MNASLPILPPDWDPPGCLAKDDYWQWDYGGTKNRPTVFGGPSQTSSCFPLTGTPTYAATACPTHYTNACEDRGDNGIETCCPTAYSFSCIPGIIALFRCQTRYTEDGDFLTASKKNMLNNDPPESITLKQTSGSHLVAVGLVYKIPEFESTATAISSDPSPSTAAAIPRGSSSSSTATATPEGSSSSDSSAGGLSTAAKAGVGVGVAVGALLVAALACWLIWRRRQTTRQPPAHAHYANTPTTYDEAKTPGSNTVYSPSTLSPGPQEVDDTPHRGAELPYTPHRGTELPYSPHRGAELPA